jgi:hydroxyacylglutathione hydrolase
VRLFTAAAPPFMKNAYLVAESGGPGALLIDPGDEVGQILAIAEREGLEVRAILLTHAHLDHITGVGEARAALGVETWLHADDRPLYDAVVQQGLTFGELSVRVHHTPGHSPGGVCLEVREGNGEPQLIVGDTLFAGSIGRTDLPGGNHAVLIRSIRDVLFAFDDRTPVHSGHGPSTTIGAERRTNPFLT